LIKKDNIYYSAFSPNSNKFKSNIAFIYNNRDKTKDLIYNIHSYSGDAYVIWYNTWYDSNKNGKRNEYKDINK